MLAGMNNAEYSRFIGISESLWYKFKAGKRTPSKAVIIRLSKLNAVCEKIARGLPQKPHVTHQERQGVHHSFRSRVLSWWQRVGKR